MFNYSNFNYNHFADLINSCVLRAKEAAKLVDDSGTVNNDCLVLTFLHGKRLDLFLAAGLPMSKRTGVTGHFWLDIQFGQANRNAEFCRQLTEMLRTAGIMSAVVAVSD